MSGTGHCLNGRGLDGGKLSRSWSKRFARIAALGAVFLLASSAYPAGVEICDNGVDDDGDGLVDCADPECETDPACSKCVPPGDDCFTTLCGTTEYDFAQDPIPQDFFGPGSDPFSGKVRLQGGGAFPGDTIVTRLEQMCFPDPLPHTETVPIELTNLNLQSCEPITVTFNGGQNPEDWDVFVFPSSGAQPQGTLKATKTHPGGGTYTAVLPVNADFFFQDDQFNFLGPLAAPSVVLETVAPAPWLQGAPVQTCDRFAAPFQPGWDINPDTGQPCCEETCHANPDGGHDHCTTPPDCQPCPEPPVVDCPLATDLCADRAAFGDCQGTDVELCWPKIVSVDNTGNLLVEQCECFEDECGPVDVQSGPGGDLEFSCPFPCPDPALPCVIHLDGRSTDSPSITGSKTGGQRVTCECETPPPPPDPHLTVQGTSLTFGTDDVPTIPSGFFDPGSDPFDGTVNFQGTASDTLVQRDRSVEVPVVGSTDTIPIELVSLKLVSVSPIEVTFNGGQNATLWNVEVTLSDTVPPNPVGSMDVTKTFDNGGTFDAQVHVRPKLVFTQVDDPTEERTLDYGVESIPDILINFLGAHWVETLGAGLAGSILAPNDGNFVPGVVQNDPNDPDNTQKVVQATGNSKGGGVSHPVQPRPLCPLPFGPDDPCAPFQTRDCQQTAPGQDCLPTVVQTVPGTTFFEVVECGCRTFDECHVEFDDAGPFCVGDCPDSQQECELVGEDTDGDGVEDTFRCDCVDVEKVCIYRVDCVDGACENCPFTQTGGLCQAFGCIDTCQVGFTTTCGDDCCLELTWTGECRPAAGEPPCPVEEPCECDPTAGACCEDDGTCNVVIESKCQDGTYLGDDTVCGDPGKCCFADGRCIETTEACCADAGGVFVAGGTCNPPVECCLPGGRCVDMDRECCLLFGGSAGGPGSTCDPPEECCTVFGTCVDTDPDCCDRLFGGTPGGPGSACAPREACCFPSGACANLEPDCCEQQGGTPQGVFNICLGDANGNFIDDQCEGGFGVCPLPDAPILALCDTLQNTDCRSLNAGNELCLPKSVVFDFFSGPQAVKCACFAPPPGPCGPIEVRQDPLLGREFSCPGQCPNADDECQIHFNGSPTGKTSVFEFGVPLGTVVTCDCRRPPRLEACCLPDGRCTFLTPGDCRGRKGKPLGPGSTCLGDGNNNGIDDACEGEECEQCGPGLHWIHNPACPPGGLGLDIVSSGAVLGVDVTLDCIADTSVVLGGPAAIQKRGPKDDSDSFPGTRPVDNHFDVIDTEILAMNLTGGGLTLLAGQGLGAQPLPATLGAVAELPANPSLAESFFEVFAEITDLGGNKFYNQTPVTVQTVVPCLPPKRIYVHITGCTPLFDAPTGGNHVANLVRARHFTLPDCCLETVCIPNVSVQECKAMNGKPVPQCLGDNNNNGIDDACEEPECVPRDDGLDCEPVQCPPDSAGNAQECRPTVVGIVPGTTQFTVLDCDCTNTCHIELDAAVGPLCTGPCPNADDECRLISKDTTGDGVDDWFTCRCEPKPACEPNDARTACEPAECPDPDDVCRPTKLAQTKSCFGALPPLPCKTDADCAGVPNSFCETKLEILECDCGGEDECHVTIDLGTTDPTCVGGCPDDPTQTCELTQSTQVNPDGTTTVVSACDCVPPPPDCQPIPGALACEPTICPNADEICRPTLVGIDDAGNLVVKECDCLRDDECHIEFTSAGPACKGICPDGNQVCELLLTDTNGDGVVDVMRCECVPPPPPDCEPTDDGFTCKPTICPDPTEFCVPKEVGFNPLTGQLEVLRCDCVREEECRVALGPAGPFCTGLCPNSDEKCTLFKSDTTGDGIPDRFECDCVPPDPPVCEPTADGQACVPTKCPNPDEICRPTKVRLIPGTTELEIVECDCVKQDVCHIAVGPAGPTCKGVCPDPNDVCRLQSADSDGDGVDDEFSCECTGLECKPASDGLSCVNPSCPADDVRCSPRCAVFDPETGNVRITECDCREPDACGVRLVSPGEQPGGTVAGVAGVDPCVVPDDGSGTVKLPPDGCPYLSPDEFHEIVDGLPAGTTIEMGAIHKDFICERADKPGDTLCSFLPDGIECAQSGGGLGGEQECHRSSLELQLVGNGDLLGFNRLIVIPVEFETHTGNRTPFETVQSFETDMFRLQGEISGDPDFDLLRITAGTDFGLPSPGQTTLTQLPSGDFQVDSFFDIEYRIDYQGAPGSALEGKSGSTTGTIRMQTPIGKEPTCDGLCPPGFACVPSRTELPDGTIEICCDCDVACKVANPPITDKLPDEPGGALVDSSKNRFLTISTGDEFSQNRGRAHAIRVTIEELPAPYNGLTPAELWVGVPTGAGTDVERLSSRASVALGDPIPADDTRFKRVARLRCGPPDPQDVFCRDWTNLHSCRGGGMGVIATECDPTNPNACGGNPALCVRDEFVHLYHPLIIPGGRYRVEVLDCECDPTSPDSFSAPLFLNTSRFGDLAGGTSCAPPAENHWCAPDGNTVVGDVVAAIDTFGNKPIGLIKPRAEAAGLGVSPVDGIIGVSDLVIWVDAVLGKPMTATPMAPPIAPPCP